jgi:RNA polymerase sigma-70 factor (ECF subfamily)
VQAELAPSVAAMVNALPEPYREALYLTEYQGLSQRELAARLGISLSGAKSRVQRAREKLKQLLLDCCHFEFDRLGRIIDYQPRCTCCSTRPEQIRQETAISSAPCCTPAGETAPHRTKHCGS